MSRPRLVLPDGAAPERLAEGIDPDFIEDVDTHRALDCPSYDDCLTWAGARNWRSFSCATCPLRAPVVLEAESARRALGALDYQPEPNAAMLRLFAVAGVSDAPDGPQ